MARLFTTVLVQSISSTSLSPPPPPYTRGATLATKRVNANIAFIIFFGRAESLEQIPGTPRRWFGRHEKIVKERSQAKYYCNNVEDISDMYLIDYSIRMLLSRARTWNLSRIDKMLYSYL